MFRRQCLKFVRGGGKGIMDNVELVKEIVRREKLYDDMIDNEVDDKQASFLRGKKAAMVDMLYLLMRK